MGEVGDLLVRQVPIFDLNLLHVPVEVDHSAAMLFLPLFSDFLLRNHDGVGSLFVGLVSLFSFKQLVFKMGHFDVALVIQLINSAMEDDFKPVQLGDGRLFFIPQLVNKFTKALVIVEIALVVSHV